MSMLRSLAFDLIVFSIAVQATGVIVRERRVSAVGTALLATGAGINCAITALGRDWILAAQFGVIAAGSLVLLVTDRAAPWRRRRA
jgi:hypothetical protein